MQGAAFQPSAWHPPARGLQSCRRNRFRHSIPRLSSLHQRNESLERRLEHLFPPPNARRGREGGLSGRSDPAYRALRRRPGRAARCALSRTHGDRSAGCRDMSSHSGGLTAGLARRWQEAEHARQWAKDKTAAGLSRSLAWPGRRCKGRGGLLSVVADHGRVGRESSSRRVVP